MSLQGKVALVSGASRGIGADIARALGAAGALVLVAARTEQPRDPRLPGSIHSVSDSIRDAGGLAEAIRLDVRDPDSIVSAVASVAARFGQIDILINNAAVLVPGTIDRLPTKHLELMWQVNLRGPFLLIREILPLMTPRGSGHILNISATSASLPGPGPYGGDSAAGASAFVMLKAGLERLSQALAAELTPQRVAVNVLMPADRIRTPGNLWAENDPAHPRVDFETAVAMGAAAVWICEQPPDFTGQIVVDERIVAGIQ